MSLFWNMSMLGEDLMFVENGAGRYSIGSTTDGLASNPDGSLTLSIQQDRPDHQLAQTKWLPAPDAPVNHEGFYGPRHLCAGRHLPTPRSNEARVTAGLTHCCLSRKATTCGRRYCVGRRLSHKPAVIRRINWPRDKQCSKSVL